MKCEMPIDETYTTTTSLCGRRRNKFALIEIFISFIFCVRDDSACLSQ